jgi:hypothetical protein
MKLRCPVCHTSNSLEAYVSDDAGRELLGLLASTGNLMRPLVHCLGLFRPAQRDLSHARAIKLLRDLLDLHADPARLAQALTETVESIRAKQQAGEIRPLKNHNYLKRVLESVAIDPAGPLLEQPQGQPSRGKRAQGMIALQAWAGDDWLRIEICNGLMALLAAGRDGAPAADTIVVTASLWETLLRNAGITIEQIDRRRIQIGFNDLLNKYDKWPEPKDLLPRMPRRPHRESLDAPIPADDIAKGRDFFRSMSEGEYGTNS